MCHILACWMLVNLCIITLVNGQTLLMQDDLSIATNSANATNSSTANVWELIQALVLGRVPADRILELFYWGQKPEVLGSEPWSILDLRPESSAAITAFLAVVDLKSISIEVDDLGRLISSPEVTAASPILREVEKVQPTQLKVARKSSRSIFSQLEVS